MHSSLYLSLLAIMYFYFSFEVIKQRRMNRTAYGFGSSGKDLLAAHVSAHSNFAAYVPMFALLLIVAENFWALPFWVVHPVGLVFLLGRFLHFLSLTKFEHKKPPIFKFRVAGMLITFFSLLGLALYIIARYALKLAMTA